MFGSDDFPMISEVEHGLPPHYPPMAVGFGSHPILDQVETSKLGYDVYKDAIFVKIATPGDKTSLYFQPATEQHKRRFPKAWAEFQKREQSGGTGGGLPVEQWAMISKSTALNLRVAHVHTVEALAAMDDTHMGHLSNGRELREKARAFIAARNDGAALAKVASEKQALQDQITALQNQIAAMANGNIARIEQPTQAAHEPGIPNQAHQASVEAEVARAARRPRARASA